jgi:hypothetical protein
MTLYQGCMKNGSSKYFLSTQGYIDSDCACSNNSNLECPQTIDNLNDCPTTLDCEITNNVESGIDDFCTIRDQKCSEAGFSNCFEAMMDETVEDADGNTLFELVTAECEVKTNDEEKYNCIAYARDNSVGFHLCDGDEEVTEVNTDPIESDDNTNGIAVTDGPSETQIENEEVTSTLIETKNNYGMLYVYVLTIIALIVIKVKE